jgi:hypothetical protein
VTWDFDICQTGIPSDLIYERIATLDNNVYSYMDDNNGVGLPQGFEYCYRIVPLYDDAKGFASNEACAFLVRGIPVITNVSIEETSEENGKIFLAWSKPTEIDTIEHPGPYSYKIFRSTGLYGQAFENEPIAEFTDLNDTLYTDIGLNTSFYAYSYKVELHNIDGMVSQPMIASSVWLKASGADNQILLKPDINVNWVNEVFTYYQVFSNVETELVVQDSASFIHSQLTNGEIYSYRLKTEGQYYEEGFIKPLVNYSQIVSAIPVDTIPPDPPQLAVSADCDLFTNKIEWYSSDNEIVKINLYHAVQSDFPLNYIASFSFPDTTTYVHRPELGIGGCYAAKAIDSAGNISEFSIKICIDSCDIYKLPNVMTLNSGNINGIFRPIGEDQAILNTILKADTKIYSRWGNLVYKTNDRLINWDGRDMKTNKFVSTGVYYYIINLTEQRISGPEERYEVGFIHVYTFK